MSKGERLLRSFGIWFALGVAGLLAACGGSSGGTSPTQPTVNSTSTLSSISVTPASMSVPAGLTQQFTATGLYSDGSKQDLSKTVTWSSANTQVATIDAAGLVSAVTSGSTTVTATTGGVSGSTLITVTPATLVSIGVTPAAPSIALGTTRGFTAIGVYTDNSTHDLTSMVTWVSSNTTVATISNSSGANGVATSAATGTSQITASLGGVKSPAVALTVTPATLVSIGVTPAAPSIVLGSTEQFTATGTYTNGTTQTLTTSVTWSATGTAATISNTAGSKGLATSAATGTSQITASLGGVASPAVALTVTPATLVSIGVTPAAPSIALGTTQQFTATGVYSNNTTQNLTAAVTWHVTGSAATVSNAAPSNGLATSAATGASQITASFSGVTSPAVTLTVTSATLVSIAVSPAAPSIAAGTTQQFAATGTYSDNTTQTLTTSVTWTATGTATISNAAGTQGLATAGSTAGPAQITAALGNVTSPAATLTVTSATLVSIAVSPTTASIAKGTTQQFTAAGTYSDNSTQDLTASVTWNSDATSVATISSASGSNGLATSPPSGSVGTTHISATLNGVTSPAAALTVTPATLVSLAITPNPASVALGVEEQFTATGTYTDNSTQDLTSSAVWSSDTVNVATISNASGSQGLAMALGYGTANISAAVGSVTATTVVLTVGTGADTVLYSFGNGADGGNPAAGLVQDSQGNLYGTTSGDGGATSWGTVFKLTPGGVYTVLHIFTPSTGDGGTPFAGLTLASDGNLYGTTLVGGIGVGTVFKITPAGNESVLYTFGAGSDGGNPKGAVTQGTDGNLYGTTAGGGANSDGTVFQLTLGGTHTVIYSFQGGGDGAQPAAGLVQGNDGNFYGTTLGDGTSNFGTVFQVTPGGAETVLHVFTGYPSDGAASYAALVQGSDGAFYGVTSQGGTSNNGMLFQVTSAGSETVLYSFAGFGGGNDGSSPTGTLIQGSDGTFYGTTQYGGAGNAGTVFQYTPNVGETVLYSFTGQTNAVSTPDGAGPVGGVIRGSDGSLYGTTIDGGLGGYGTIFKY